MGYFGGNTSQGRRNYRKFVEEGLEGPIESPLRKGKGHGIVGDEDFMEGVRDRFLKRVRESREVPGFKGIISQIAPAKILGVICKETGVNGEELQKKGERGIGRGLLMEMLYRYGALNQRDIGEMMGVDYSSVSVARKRFQLLSEGDKKVLELKERVENKINQG